MEMNKENFEKLLNQIKASGKPATEWFGKYTHDILMHPDNWWEALAVNSRILSPHISGL